MSPRVIAGVALLSFLATPFARGVLEARLTTHLLVQMPLLVLSGWCIAPILGPIVRRSGRGGPGMAIAIPLLLFWMLPRSMDAALDSARMNAAKFAILALGVGVPLARSWPSLGTVARGFVLGNAISMLAVLGWLYRSAPERVCNFYLRDDQLLAGALLLGIGLVLALALSLRAFLPARSQTSESWGPLSRFASGPGVQATGRSSEALVLGRSRSPANRTIQAGF